MLEGDPFGDRLGAGEARAKRREFWRVVVLVGVIVSVIGSIAAWDLGHGHIKWSSGVGGKRDSGERNGYGSESNEVTELFRAVLGGFTCGLVFTPAGLAAATKRQSRRRRKAKRRARR